MGFKEYTYNIGEVKVKQYEDFYANLDPKFIAEVTHLGLNEHKVLSARYYDILDDNIERLIDKWDKKWQVIKKKNDLHQQAKINTELANKEIKSVENILKNSLNVDSKIDWADLKDNSIFEEFIPRIGLKNFTVAPNKFDLKYQPKFYFWDKLIKSRKQKKINEYENLFKSDSQKHQDYKYQKSEYEKRKSEFYDNQNTQNKRYDSFKENYLKRDAESVENYCSLVLNKSEYPSSFPKSFEMEYCNDNDSLIINYLLPKPDDMPSIKEVKFIQTKKELKEYYISDSQKNKNYESVIYQIALRTLHELFDSDVANALDSITFNGWVSYKNKSNGLDAVSSIISLQADKEEFQKINLEFVEPKECFKGLDGVGTSKLYELNSIKPISNYKVFNVVNFNKKKLPFSFKETRSNSLISSKNLYLFFDTETTGLPKNYHAPITDLNNWPRLVQLAYLLYDSNGNKIAGEDFIIKPEGFTIPKQASEIHGISNVIANQKGLAIKLVMQKFNSVIEQANHLVAHNISFDEKIVGAEFLRLGIQCNISSKNKTCTKEKSTKFCAIEGEYGYKWPKLSELHYKLFGEDFNEEHNAAADVTATAKCFWELRRLGII